MSKNLVIVESPAKAKTIEKYLGKDFIVKSSFGHIRDLPKKNMGINIQENFLPEYEVSVDKKKLVSELKKDVKNSDIIWLATDEDREGEAISWHLYEELGLQKKDTKRITFNEITKTAILNAIENPREINIDLVNAQQARRLLDRIVGFELSPILWRKIKSNLSAGRVQSVSVRIIVERENEIKNFVASSSFKISAFFNISGVEVKANLNKNIENEIEVLEFLEKCKSKDFFLKSIEKKPTKRSPSAPFTTSTLQQEAFRKIGASVARTMSLAQKLYEAGHITYMRTDSTSLSEQALNNAKDEINSKFGQEYFTRRIYKSKSKGAQEAHEAIRPTDFSKEIAGKDDSEKRLYSLIWKRAIASQMSDAKLEKTNVKISNDFIGDYYFVAIGEILQFEGFLKVYNYSADDEDNEENSMLPQMKENQQVNYSSIECNETYSRPKPRYSEASLVQKLEELGIGRPSTYAPTISTILKREYVSKDDIEYKERQIKKIILKDNNLSSVFETNKFFGDKNKLHPTDIGIIVNNFLVDHFQNILDYGFTAKIEEEFDEIANGKKDWKKLLSEFYNPFHNTIEDTFKNSERYSGERNLGVDSNGKNVIARLGKYGPMIQIGNTDDEEKPRFASLLKNQSIETITLDEALILFNLPREVGLYNDYKISANIGRFGPYVVWNKLFCSIKGLSEDVFSIGLDTAIELIEKKIETEKNKLISKFENSEIEVLNGRYGAYIKQGKDNYKIPKDSGKEAKDLTEEDCLKIIKDSEKKPTKTVKKSITKKSTTKPKNTSSKSKTIKKK